MKTIGMLGGMSWESTVTYYQRINQAVQKRLGGLHSAEICLLSLDMEPIERMQVEGAWDVAGDMLAKAAKAVAAGGADFIIICTNTMHRVADQVRAAVSIPLLHIADATAAAIKANGHRRVGLLGTNFTMEQDFYRGHLADIHGLDVLIPNEAGRKVVHDVIYQELCLGQIKDASRKAFLEIIDGLKEQGAEGVILGCTEIGLLLDSSSTDVPLYNTTLIHADAAVEFALRDGPSSI